MELKRCFVNFRPKDDASAVQYKLLAWCIRQKSLFLVYFQVVGGPKNMHSSANPILLLVRVVMWTDPEAQHKYVQPRPRCSLLMSMVLWFGTAVSTWRSWTQPLTPPCRLSPGVYEPPQCPHWYRPGRSQRRSSHSSPLSKGTGQWIPPPPKDSSQRHHGACALSPRALPSRTPMNFSA